MAVATNAAIPVTVSEVHRAGGFESLAMIQMMSGSGGGAGMALAANRRKLSASVFASRHDSQFLRWFDKSSLIVEPIVASTSSSSGQVCGVFIVSPG